MLGDHIENPLRLSRGNSLCLYRSVVSGTGDDVTIWTAGEWRYSDVIGTIEADDGTVIAECVDEQNGELLAAAPLLANAIAELLEVYVDPKPMWSAGDRNVRVKRARALLARIGAP